MSYYAIGIGGTGAKCLESLIHLSAAGLMPDASKDLYLLFVDSDRSNGNGTRAGELLRCYQACKPENSGGFFKTRIPTLSEATQANDSNHWSPTKIDEKLDNFISKSRLDENWAQFPFVPS